MDDSRGTLRGAKVLVTGATGGIGRAVAEAVAGADGQLHVLSRNADALAPLAERTGGRSWPADLSDDADVWFALDTLQETLGGPPDAVVTAAGAFELAPLAETSVEAFDRNLQVNLRGPFLVIRALLPAMLERGGGRIVSVGSVAGRTALPGNAAYGASKFGLRGMHEVLVEELRGTGVAATLVEPAATDTPLWDPLDPDARDDLPARSAMLRPEDVAGAVLFVLTRPAHVRVPLIQIESG
jgi:NAD(P)-dependent dehydrogenase (short-subunit alcohol dehydrogenase family)